MKWACAGRDWQVPTQPLSQSVDTGRSGTSSPPPATPRGPRTSEGGIWSFQSRHRGAVIGDRYRSDLHTSCSLTI